MRKFITIFSLSILIVPAITFAQAGDIGIETALSNVGALVNALVPIAIGFAVLFFFWGLAKYILNAGDEEKKSEGRNIMIWGLIALFIMVSIWGIINVLAETFGV
ncbi:MAG: hypothetical protein ACE5F2_02590, partial [Candidatus Paceibacteria bacterium]